MNHDPSPKSVRLGVNDAVYIVVRDAVSKVANWDVFDAIWDAMHDVVDRTACRVMYVAVHDAVIVSSPHTNLDKFVNETEQRWSVT